MSSGFSSDFTDFPEWDSESLFSAEHICGVGASCMVYVGYVKGLKVAIKRLKEEYSSNPLYVEAFRKEFQIGWKLKHESLPMYRDFHADWDEVYIVMDYIDGVSVMDFMDSQEGRAWLSDKRNVKKFLRQLLDVIGYLHRNGIIHCDIKPANIMLRHSDRGLVLIDLDKAYSDTFDRTHGGTPGSSDPLNHETKPTVNKDFSAISTLIDSLSSHVDSFPISSLRRFKKECRKPDATYESLSSALDSSGLLIPIHSNSFRRIAGIATGVVLIASVVIVFLHFGNRQVSVSPQNARDSLQSVIPKGNSERQYDEDSSAKSVPVAVPMSPSDPLKGTSNLSASQSQSGGETPGVKGLAKDFDERMAPFFQAVEEGRRELRSDKYDYNRLIEIVSRVNASYHDNYRRVVKEYKGENPDRDGLDVEMEVARVSEKSRAFRQFGLFATECQDTLNLHQ